ncbi:hypothetical protein D3C85_1661750 [compost metagenome]
MQIVGRHQCLPGQGAADQRIAARGPQQMAMPALHQPAAQQRGAQQQHAAGNDQQEQAVDMGKHGIK